MDKMWYYAAGGTERRGPVSETQLRELIQQGQVADTDLLWTEGMASWTALNAMPEFKAASPAVAPAEALVAVPAGLSSWLSFVGVLNIIAGALSCISCVGLPVGIFMILAGVAALGTRTALQQIPAFDPALAPVLNKLRSYFLMTGWVFILHIITVVLMLLVYAGVIAAVVMRAGHGFD